MDINLRLLVHAGASSTRQNDDQRVAQAAAYLDLEHTLASRTHRIWPPEHFSSERLCDLPQISTTEEPDSTAFIDDTQLAYTSLESQLLPSSARTLHRTHAKRHSCEPAISSTTPVPRRSTRLSESPTDCPRFSEQEQRAGSAHGLNGSPPGVQHAQVGQSVSQQKLKEKTHSTEGTPISNDTTSELPTSYLLDDVGDEVILRPQLSERSLSDPGPSPARQDGLQEGSSQVHDQQISLREQQQPLNTNYNPSDIQRPVALDAYTTTAPSGSVATQGALLNSEFSAQDLPTLIRPAGPVTAIGPFTTHVTHTLRKLAHNPELTATFVPSWCRRSPDIHERGHWEVQCSTWTPELQSSFWKTLESVVGTGRAGWGVWCTRGAEAPLCSQSSQQRAECAPQVTETSFGPARIYCWGEIVKHIYLLLFVASNSKVRKLGLRWLDAEGLVVIQMRSG